MKNADGTKKVSKKKKNKKSKKVKKGSKVKAASFIGGPAVLVKILVEVMGMPVMNHHPKRNFNALRL